MNLLQEIGEHLDQNRFPFVFDGGFVRPGKTTDLTLTPGQETKNERKRRSKTGQRQRPSRRQGATYRPRSSRPAAPVISTSLRKHYETELEAVQKAHPGTKIWQQKEGLWLLTESSLFPSLGKKATFLTAIPYFPAPYAKSWGFWTTVISAQWIGPRHTNFPDGSICAFEQKDGTWILGDSLIKLLDLYTLWATRHLYMATFRRWPGCQSVPHPYERLTEIQDDEYCGCDISGKLYVDCCKPNDLALDMEAIKKDFLLKYCWGLRNPPAEILKFINQKNQPPPIRTLFP